MTAPTGLPRGRPPGTGNKMAAEVKELAQSFTKTAIRTAAARAGLIEVPLFNKNGTPKMVKALDKDGKPKLDKKGNPIMKQAEGFRPARSETVQFQYTQLVIERGVGKAPQPLANDIDNPLTDVKPAGQIVFTDFGTAEAEALRPKDSEGNVIQISPYFSNKDYKPEPPKSDAG